MKQNLLKVHFLAVARAFAIVTPMKAQAAALAATSPPTSGVSLDELVNESLEKNPELNFYRAEIAAAKGERMSAGV